MRKNLIILLLTIFNTVCFGQVMKENALPTDVLKNFKTTFFDAKKTTWVKEGENFIASFTLDEMKSSATYNEQGEWLQTSTPMDEKEIPSSITNYVKNNLPEARIKQSDYVEKPNKEIFYYVVAKKDGVGQQGIELFFSKSGKFTKKIDPLDVKTTTDIVNQNKKDSVKTPITNTNTDVTTNNTNNDVNNTNTDDNNLNMVIKPGDSIARYKVTEKELPGPIITYFKKNFIDQRIKLAEIQEKPNGNKNYYLQVKKDGYKQPMTELYFNLDGKILRRIDPVVKTVDKDIDEMSDLGNDNTNNVFVDEVVEWKELPTPITSYIQKNYKTLKIKQSLLTKKNDIKLYQITLKKEGTKDTVLLYFDLNGKKLKPEDIE